LFYRANGAFRQSSSSIFGNAEVPRKRDNFGTPRMFEEHLLEQMRRVPLGVSKIRETFAGLKRSERQKRLEQEKTDRFLKIALM